LLRRYNAPCHEKYKPKPGAFYGKTSCSVLSTAHGFRRAACQLSIFCHHVRASPCQSVPVRVLSTLPEMNIALGAKLKHCPAVQTVGLRCNWDDYTSHEQALIRNARRIYFPTVFYAGSLHAAGKSIFPSMASYHHLGDKVRQLALFRFLNVPMPRTRLFMGSRSSRHRAILSRFSFPFIAKIPIGSGLGRGVFLINSSEELSSYLELNTGISYIQEYIPMDMDLRVVIAGHRVIHAYWKRSLSENFRTNVAQGGRVILGDIPGEALEMALNIAESSGIDYAGFDLCVSDGRWMVLEANMNFGTEGFCAAGLRLEKLLCNMICCKDI